MPLLLVVLVCTALPGSQYRDHCREEVTPMVVTLTPHACVAKAQEVMAANPDRYDGDIRAIGCRQRML